MTDIVETQTAIFMNFLTAREAGIDAINGMTSHIEAVRRDLDAPTRRAVAERLRRSAPAGDTIRLHSILFQLTGDLYHYERILHYLLIGGDQIGPEMMHYTYWCISRQLFLGVAAPEKSATFGPCDLYHFHEELVRAVARRWTLAPSYRERQDGPIRRVAVLTNQFTNDRHQPTRDCFDFASRMQDEFGLEVAIINCNTLPLKVENLFIPPMAAELVDAYEGVVAVEMFGRRVKVASFTERPFSEEKIRTIVEAVDGYDPDLIVTFGGSNVVGDLFAEANARPVVCIPTTSGLTISLAHIVLGYDEGDYTDHLPALYREPFARRFRPFTLGFTPPPTAGDAGDYGLGSPPFLFAVVGTRLDLEVTPEFLDIADRVLDRCPGAMIAFAGEVRELRGRIAKTRNAARMRCLGHIGDIRAFYRRCHAFLNPSRQGGGGSGAYAIAEGLPVVTLAWGDVASVAGEGIPVPDWDAYIERAHGLSVDPELRARQAGLSKTRFETVGDRHRCTERLIAYGEEARAMLRAINHP